MSLVNTNKYKINTQIMSYTISRIFIVERSIKTLKKEFFAEHQTRI